MNDCRICLDTESDLSTLVSPCKCIGSGLYVHEKCISKWRGSRFSKNYYMCKECNNPYNDVKYDWRYLFVDWRVRIGFIFSVLTIFYLSFVIFFQYLSYRGFGTYITDQNSWTYRCGTYQNHIDASLNEPYFSGLYKQSLLNFSYVDMKSNSIRNVWADEKCKHLTFHIKVLEMRLYYGLYYGYRCFYSNPSEGDITRAAATLFVQNHPGMMWNVDIPGFTLDEKYFIWPFYKCAK